MRLVSWNVNSLRSALRQGFSTWLETTQPDIVCLQEVRAELKHLLPLEPLFPSYKATWHPAVRPGYAGVAILSKIEPVKVEFGLNNEADPEGRALTIDYGPFRVASLYAPNAVPLSPKIPIKTTWLDNLRRHVFARLDKPFFVCGDLNVAYTQHDSRGVPRPQGINGCTNEERSGFKQLLEECVLFDPMREQSADRVLSTWWHAGSMDRRPELGVRFDYILLADTHRPLSKIATIEAEVFGSDHCPVRLEVDDTLLEGTKQFIPVPPLRQAGFAL